MRFLSLKRPAAVAVVCLTCLASGVSAQQGPALNSVSSSSDKQQADSDKEKPQPEKLTIAEVEARKQRVDELKDLEEQARNEIKALYDQALKELQAAEESQAKAAQYKKQTDEVPQELTSITEQLASLPETQPDLKLSDVELPQDKSLAEVQQQLQEEQTALDELKKQLAELDARIAQRTADTKALTEFLSSAPKQLQELQQKLDALPAENADPRKQAERTLLRAQFQALEQKIAERQAELTLYQARDAVDYLRQKRDLLSRQVALEEQRMQLRWQKFQDRRRTDVQAQLLQARTEAARAEENAAKAGKNSPAALLEKLARENLAYAEELDKRVEEIETTVSNLLQAREFFQSVEATSSRTRSMVDSVGETDAIGHVLRANRNNLPSLEEHRRLRRQAEEKLQSVELRRYHLDDARDELADPASAAEKYLAEQAAEGEISYEQAKDAELKQAVVAYLTKRKDLLDALIRQYQSHYDRLMYLNEEEKKLIATTEEFRTYINERVLWIRSCESLVWTLADEDRRSALATDLSEALVWLITPAHWRDVGKQLIAGVRDRPVELSLAGLVLLGLLAYRRRMRRRLREIGEEAAQGYARRYLPTLEALLLTVLLSIFWPGVFAVAGWSLRVAGGSEFVRSAAQALLVIAAFLLPLEFVRKACAVDGLTEAHFGWSAGSMRLLRRHLRWFVGAVVPLVFVVVALLSVSQAGSADAEAQAWRDSLGRLAFIASMILLSVFAQRVLRFAGGVLHELWAGDHYRSLHRLRYVWYPLCLAAPLILALLAALGYYYTARQVGWRIYETAWLVLGIILLRAMVFRWVLINRRKLTVQQARDRLTEAATRESEAAPAAGAVPAVSEQELDVSAVSEQTHRLLQVALLAVAAVGTFFIWVDILPALAKLDNVPAWPFGEVGDEFLSLGAVALALIIIALAFFAAKNVPGLLEIAVLQRMPVDSGVRYAISSLVSYTIVVVGVVMAFGALGVGWGKVQWLVAAVTVGLGFGLQEIFANFVSGLIILFERPVRVGDIITIDDTSGWVSQIRIRATTIVRFDRRELIVPNKEFVTGRLLNWTHSNATIRPDIDVGIAYGSDTEKARQLLLKIAREHPLVLDDPAPLATFHGFGDSSLTLTLRPYLPDLNNYLDVIHELHTTIHEEFRQAGIEIAFPQRDLHVRSMPESWRAPQGNGSAASPQQDEVHDKA